MSRESQHYHIINSRQSNMVCSDHQINFETSIPQILKFPHIINFKLFLAVKVLIYLSKQLEFVRF